MRMLLRLAKDGGGGAIVEFALLAPLLLTLLLGGLDFGRMFYVRQGLEYATEEAARYYMLNPASGQSDITTYLLAKDYVVRGGSTVNTIYVDSKRLPV